MGLAIYLSCVAVIMLSAISMIRRINKVGNYKRKIINNIADIQKASRFNKFYLWDIYESVSFDIMVFKFWRRLASFYPKEFLDEIGMK